MTSRTPKPQANAAYLKTRVLTASPAELRQLLLDGAVRFARQAREGLEKKDWEKSYEGFTSCRNIVMELISSMKPEVEPELCARLSSLYTFIYSELMYASHERDIARLDKAIELLEYERETWSLLLERLASERAAGSPEAAEPAGQAEPNQRAPRSISLQG